MCCTDPAGFAQHRCMCCTDPAGFAQHRCMCCTDPVGFAQPAKKSCIIADFFLFFFENSTELFLNSRLKSIY
jgi:hypothetical protein